MRNPISVTLPFTAAVGSAGAVHLRHDGQCGDMARLSITVGHRVSGSSIDAALSVDTMRQLVDGLMDCIYALERNGRIHGEGSHD